MYSTTPPLIWFSVTGLVSVLGMKLSSLSVAKLQSGNAAFLFFSPVFSTRSWAKKVPVDRAKTVGILIQLCLLSFPFMLTWWLYLAFLPPLRPGTVAQCYLALIPLYFMGQFLSALLQLAYLSTGWLYPAHLRFPPLSRSLAEFWGIRWGTWVSDWLKQMIFDRNWRQPAHGLFAAFLLSGLWHEALINVPLFLFWNINCLGWMMIYFILQALGIVLERKLPLRKNFPHRIYTLTFVVLPAPLFVNEGILRATGLLIH